MKIFCKVKTRKYLQQYQSPSQLCLPEKRLRASNGSETLHYNTTSSSPSFCYFHLYRCLGIRSTPPGKRQLGQQRSQDQFSWTGLEALKREAVDQDDLGKNYQDSLFVSKKSYRLGAESQKMEVIFHRED